MQVFRFASGRKTQLRRSASLSGVDIANPAKRSVVRLRGRIPHLPELRISGCAALYLRRRHSVRIAVL